MKQKVSKATQRFLALTRKEKALAVAKDVIKILETKFIEPSHAYIITSNSFWDNDLPAKENMSKLENCNCCLLGACMVSTVRLGNTLTLRELKSFGTDIDDSDAKKSRGLLKKVFSPKQMLLIEEAYERDPNQSRVGRVEGAVFIGDQRDKCREFGNQFEDDEERMVAICKNIIKNGGVFKP